MLITQSLTFQYNANTHFQFPEITLETAQHLLVLGDSGVGKTTLLHLLAGILKPKTGNITISNTNITTLSPSKLDHFRGKHIGLVFQQPHFIQSLHLLDNLLMIQRAAGKMPSKQQAIELLAQLGLEEKAKKSPHQLSQGEQQRAGIALATINQPQLILADEPTASLDDNNCFKVLDLLINQAQQTQANLLVITHDARVKRSFNQVLTLSKETIQR